jgi:hypothetical protein
LALGTLIVNTGACYPENWLQCFISLITSEPTGWSRACLNYFIVATPQTSEGETFLEVSMSIIMMVTRLSLSDQAKLTKEITAQVKLLSDEENEDVATDSDSPNQPYDQAKALWRTSIDMDHIAAGLPCGSESFLLMFARWKKLERDLYNERKKYVSQP